ncbi:MAG TPA: LysM peptidoglycan-binding domain-containing protein [Sedimentisphaerales bacterium]|nr:LysM peptidoglycan-binding domain-containing protein [Sedimentisphaerales bacterium]
MILGLAVVIAAGLWLCTQPSLSIKPTTPESSDGRLHREGFFEPGAVGVDRAQQPSNTTATNIGDNSPTEQGSQPRRSGGRQRAEQAGAQFPNKDSREKTREGRVHIVREGDTLLGISEKYYGSPNKWEKIFEANRASLKNPNNLKPGARLIIPE